VARPGQLSRHNVKYWQSGDWWGFGCGAHSTVHGRRWQNIAATRDYADRIDAGHDVRQNVLVLSADDRLGEALFTGLRLTEGVDREAIADRFGVDPWSRYETELAPFAEAGLLWRRDGRFGLTRRGMLLANEILMTFV